MTNKVQEWEVTSEDPTQTELEDQDEIVDVTDADAPGGHDSFAPPPAKHSLFKSIGWVHQGGNQHWLRWPEVPSSI
jgi:hypothetical protein